MTQKDAVRDWLEMHGFITSADAIYKLGITRLSAVIFELRKEGMNIESDRKMVDTRYGRTEIAVYRVER